MPHLLQTRPVQRVLLFLFVWLMLGFSIGASTLLGPVRWVTSFSRRSGWGDGAESALVTVIIVVLVGVSAAIALALTRLILITRRQDVRLGIPALAGLATLGALWLWMNPALLHADMGEETTAGSHFTFGPYPDEETLERLKSEGYTAVVPLLHPAVVPFEPKLLADERAAAARAGIEVIHIPMLPWISENSGALERIRTLATSGAGRYYVHCYLGRDRVQVVKRLVEETGVSASIQALEKARRLEDKSAFERGDLYRLDEHVFLTPYPTDEEFLVYFLTGRVNHVVSLLDPENRRDRPWIEKERRLFSDYRLSFVNLPIPSARFDPFLVLEAARRVKLLKGTVVVHAFLSPSTGKSSAAEGFLQAFRSGRPPLPPSKFRRPMKAGPVEVIAPHIAVGPRPAGPEFGTYLQRRGVREVLYLGKRRSVAARKDRAAASEARRLSWRALDPGMSDDLIKTLGDGGPYYLYGPGVEASRKTIADRFGPAIPERNSVRPDFETQGERGERPDPTATPTGDSPVTAALPDDQPGEAGRREGYLAAFMERAFPGPDVVILVGPLLLLVTGAAAWLAGWLRVGKGLATPYTRKIFHFIIFTIASLLHLTAGLKAVMLFGGIVSLVVIYAVVRGDRFPFYEALARPTDHPRRTLFVLVPLGTTALGGLLANLFFGGFAAVGYLVGGWGDAVGEPVGTAWGRHRYRVPSLAGVPAERSLEGSTAVCLMGVVAAMLALVAQGVSPATALGVGALCGVAGAAVEAFSTHGVDNLTVQVAAAGTAHLLLT